MSGGRWSLALLACWAVAAAGQAGAADPLWVDPNARAYRWPGNILRYHLDRGTLGMLDNESARARVRDGFQTWAAVDTAALPDLVEGDRLRRDVSATTGADLLTECDDELNPIIFDTDGTLVEQLYGEGASRRVLGLGGFSCPDDAGDARIAGASIILNGLFVDGMESDDNPEVSLESFQETIVHEIGHFLNLDHTQVGLIQAFDGIAANDDLIPVMFPLAARPDASLQLDDIAAISNLYPAPDFNRRAATIRGLILSADGRTPFQGGFVVARELSGLFGIEVGASSGALYQQYDGHSAPPAHYRGSYEIPGLPPGTYTVEVEQTGRFFSVGPLNPPVRLAGPQEFWNGDQEAGANPPDDPRAALTITVAAGDEVDGIDIVLNAPNPIPDNDTCRAAAGITALPFEVRMDTQWATLDDVRCTGEGVRPNANAVWFRYRAPRDQVISVDASGSNFAPALAVLATCAEPGGAERAGVCGAEGDVRIQVSLSAGEVALIAIGDRGFAGGGELGLRVVEGTIEVACAPDCDGDGRVAIADVVRAVTIALGGVPLSSCPNADPSGNGRVDIGELIQGVTRASQGCAQG